MTMPAPDSPTLSGRQPQTIVLLTQTFPPDPAAVGEHMSDLASALARRGHRVIVFTADRGYDDTNATYAARELTRDGVEIRRLPYTSFGKSTLLARAAALVSFALQAALRTATTGAVDAIAFSTSPPFIGVVATIVALVRRTPTVFWAMDLNPDQLVALGKLSRTHLVTRALRRSNRFVLRRASSVIALDPFMADRLVAQGAVRDRIVVTPPWSVAVAPDGTPREQNAFRARHDLHDRTVIMYSGNHTPSNPLNTLLDAAVALRDVPRLRFVFVGSGTAKREVEEVARRHGLDNVLSLPYQARAELATSLSAGDVHVISLGQEMAGVIHPCKVYGAMAVGRPIFYLGPSPSHVTNIIDKCGNGWHVRHGDVERAVTVLKRIAATPFDELDAMGERGRTMVNTQLEPQALVSRVADVVEKALFTPIAD